MVHYRRRVRLAAEVKGKRFRHKRGGYVMVVVSKWSRGWNCRAETSGKMHHMTEQTLRWLFDEVNDA
jgi:hypothetical protein